MKFDLNNIEAMEGLEAAWRDTQATARIRMKEIAAEAMLYQARPLVGGDPGKMGRRGRNA